LAISKRDLLLRSLTGVKCSVAQEPDDVSRVVRLAGSLTVE
jgi:hypothetical protein